MATPTSKKRKDSNLANAVEILKGAHLTDYKVSNNKTCFLFRVKRQPDVDYYPTTNKWRYKNETYLGDPAEFIAWYMVETKKIYNAYHKQRNEDIKNSTDSVSRAYADMCSAVSVVMDCMDKLGEALRNANK